MNHLMSVQHSEYKVLCNYSSKLQAWLSAFMKEYVLALKELSTSAQIAFKGRQQHSGPCFVPDQQHLSQNPWCPKGKVSINHFIFRAGLRVLMLFPEKAKGVLFFLVEAGISP